LTLLAPANSVSVVREQGKSILAAHASRPQAYPPLATTLPNDKHTRSKQNSAHDPFRSPHASHLPDQQVNTGVQTLERQKFFLATKQSKSFKEKKKKKENREHFPFTQQP
jgi:hypothetical protein